MKKIAFCLFAALITVAMTINSLAEIDLLDLEIQVYDDYSINVEEQIDIDDIDDSLSYEIVTTESENNNKGYGIPIDKQHFPDSNFRKYILDNKDINWDKHLSKEEIKNVKSISLFYLDSELNEVRLKVRTLKGIELFYNLESLDCSKCQVKQLDVSKNTKLKVLYCSQNILTSLDLSKNRKLEDLACGSNRLKELDLSKNTKLKHLSCNDNKLAKLDLRKNKELKMVWCMNNKLKSLVLGKPKELETLYAVHNNLKSIDIGGCSTLLENNRYRYHADFNFDYGKTRIMKGKTVLCEAMPKYKAVTYDDAARNPQSYKGKKICFSGKIVQVVENDTDVVFRIDTGNDEVFWCEYKKPKEYSRFLEGDVVRIYGISSGLHTYTSILGAEITIPSCKVKLIEFACHLPRN